MSRHNDPLGRVWLVDGEEVTNIDQPVTEALVLEHGEVRWAVAHLRPFRGGRAGAVILDGGHQ